MITYRMLRVPFLLGLMLSLVASCASLETQKASSITNSDWSFPEALQDALDELVLLNYRIGTMKLVMADIYPKSEIDSAIFSACSTVINSEYYQEHLKTLENSVDLVLRARMAEFEALNDVLRGPF
ncbi:MAG: hypothetical protein FWG50_07525 [Kiritimatiellaeota bacterium]|nr:hypothetical protein [Kiritimatiellota bacterium]